MRLFTGRWRQNAAIVGTLALTAGMLGFANGASATNVGDGLFELDANATATAAQPGDAWSTLFNGVHQAPDTTHPHGDLLILSDFTNGGAIGTINVYEWVGSGGSDGALNHIFPTTAVDVDCQDATASDVVCGTVNRGDGVPTGGW